MATIARLSHVGFNVPREIFQQECDFWQNVIGLKWVHGQEGRIAFYTADPLRDHGPQEARDPQERLRVATITDEDVVVVRHTCRGEVQVTPTG